MKVSYITGILRIIINVILFIAIIATIFLVALNVLIELEINAIAWGIFVLSVVAVKICAECFFALLDKYSKKSILFEKEYMLYKNKKYFAEEVLFRYFKFQWFFLESVPVVPKLVISIRNSQQIVLYITRAQLRKLKIKMQYNIIEV